MLLMAVDAYSKWLEVICMKTTTTEVTLDRVDDMFTRFGYPEQLVSGKWPQFVSREFEDYTDLNGIGM